MENENIVDLDAENQEEVIAQDEAEVVVPETTEVEPEVDEVGDLKKKNQSLYEQLQKAKGLTRGTDGKWTKKETTKIEVPVESDDLSQSELYALIKSDVNEEDIDEVKLYARSHKLSINEALKTAEVKAILGVKADYRKTSEASNTGNSRNTTHKVSDDKILQDIENGNLPDPEKLAEMLQKKRLNSRTK